MSTSHAASLHERIQQLLIERASTPDYVGRLIAFAKELTPTDARYARTLLIEACRIAAELKAPALIAETRMRLAWVRYLEGDLDVAITHASYAKSVATHAGCAPLCSAAAVVTAYVYRSLGSLDLAEEQIQEALAEARQSGDRAREADYLDELGSIYFACGDYKRAYQSHQEARTRYAANDPFLPHNANRLARSALEMGAVDDAERWAWQAINLCEVSDAQSQARYTHTLGTVLLRRHPESPGLARDTLERALGVLAKGVRNPEVEAEIYLDLGRALLAAGQRESGIKHMEVGLAIAKKKGYHPLVERAHDLLQSAYEAGGQTSKALMHCRARIELRVEREARNKRTATAVFTALESVSRLLSRWRANFLDVAPSV